MSSSERRTGLGSLIGSLPNLIGFLVILVVGYLIARVVTTIATKVREELGLDRALDHGQAGKYIGA